MELGSGTLLEIRKETAAWLIEMDIEPEHWDRSGFVTWLRSSPRHMEEFLYQSALWLELHKANPKNTTDLRGLLHDLDKVVELPRTTEKRVQASRGNDRTRGTKCHRWLTRFAACMLLFAGASAGLLHIFYDNTKVLTTAIGEQRAVRLPDRSVVYMNTDTRVEIEFTDVGREVRLVHGEALFTVERDVNRPFRVIADGIKVEALGTQFNVRRLDADTIVSVVEGRVAVVGPADLPRTIHADSSSQTGTSVEKQEGNVVRPSIAVQNATYEGGRLPPAGSVAVVAAGEQVRVSVDGAVKEERIENATAWRQRQLVFNNTPLADIAAEVARYNVTPRLQIEGESLRSREMNGVFNADDPESLIQFLEREGYSVTRSGDTVVIRSP